MHEENDVVLAGTVCGEEDGEEGEQSRSVTHGIT